MDDAVLIKQLLKVPLLRGDEALASAALNACQIRTGRKGDVVISAGQNRVPLVLVKSGSIAAFSPGDLDQSNELHSFQGPCRFGVRQLLRQDEISDVNCIVSSDSCEYLELGGNTFLELVRPKLCAATLAGGGEVLGKVDKQSGVAKFMGIRFARAERFQEPKICSAQEASASLLRMIPGPCCPQVGNDAIGGDQMAAMTGGGKPKSIPRDLLFLPTEEHDGTIIGDDRLPQTDDCLQLNVVCPANLAGSDKASAPVMVFIHGGAFIQGTGSMPVYNGAKFAAKGAVVVTINYRLGALGFLRAPGITPNLGLLDQVAALEWVAANASCFGGDCGNVTVFGESAGAMSIGCLLGSRLRTDSGGVPRNKSLFSKAILQSGAALNAHHEKQALETARYFQAHIDAGHGETVALTAGALATVRLDNIVEATKLTGLESMRRSDLYGKFMGFEPVVTQDPSEDSVFRGVSPADAIAMGEAADVTVVIGVTKDEYALFLVGQDPAKSVIKKAGGRSREAVRKVLADRLATYLTDVDRHQRVEDPELRADAIIQSTLKELKLNGQEHVQLGKKNIAKLIERINSVWLFDLPCWRLADTQSNFNSTYVYRVDFEAAIPGLGACHAIDLPLVFGTWETLPMLQVLTGTGETLESVSSSMHQSWFNFASKGNPTTDRMRGGDVVNWPVFQPARPVALVFGAESGPDEMLIPFFQQGKRFWQGIAVSKL